MDKELLKLLPQKAFKLLSVTESLKVGSAISKSYFNTKAYEASLEKRKISWKLSDILLLDEAPYSSNEKFSKDQGEKILEVYFSQFFENNLPVHIDLRKKSFDSSKNFGWNPSKAHYTFSPSFIEGVRLLYFGFYSSNDDDYEKGLSQLGIINTNMNSDQRNDIKNLFNNHFGSGKEAPVKFSLKELQSSFNTIFSFFLKNDIPLNPEFAVLGLCLVTLYLNLEEIDYPLDVRGAFNIVASKYSST